MFDRIMIPLDGSELAEQALPRAAYLAAATGGVLHLVRVIEPPAAVRTQGLGAPVNVHAESIATQRQEAAAYLERMRERLERDGGTVQTRLLDGYTAAVLIDYVREATIDLVVLTTHGRSGLTRWALGSVADRVVRGGAPAVLLVNAETIDQQEREGRA